MTVERFAGFDECLREQHAACTVATIWRDDAAFDLNTLIGKIAGTCSWSAPMVLTRTVTLSAPAIATRMPTQAEPGFTG